MAGSSAHYAATFDLEATGQYVQHFRYSAVGSNGMCTEACMRTGQPQIESKQRYRWELLMVEILHDLMYKNARNYGGGGGGGSNNQ